MDHVIDMSDPDLGLPQSIHCFQTAEALRKRFPQKDWLHLIGLIHDCGKMLVNFGEPQWAVVGDIFPVGCKFKHCPKLRYPHFFELNPDNDDPRYNTELGIYEEGCGLDNVMMSWGHDQYFYEVLKGNEGVSLPDEALYIVRYHSFWAHHYGGEYSYLLNEHDREMIPLLKEFRECDLYSKAEDEASIPNILLLRPYYESLMKKYLPPKVRF